MTSLLLFLIAIASFTFYGVVGEDKIWLLGPAYLISYVAITLALLNKARRSVPGAGMAAQGATPLTHVDGLLAANNHQPIVRSLFILFLLWGIAMVPYAAVPFEAKLTVLYVGAVFGAYLVWESELTAFKDNRLLLGFLICIVMLLALYGLIIHFKAPENILWSVRYTDYYQGRLMSTYICPNHFAHLMQMLVPFCLALIFIPQSGLLLRLLSAYTLAVFVPVLFFTESRAGWLGAIVAGGITVCLIALRRSRKLFVFLVVFVPLCLFLLLFAGWKYSETFQRRVEPVIEFLQGQVEGGIGSDSKDFRPQTWMDTLVMVKEAPLIGFGPGNYRYTFPEYRKRCRAARLVTGHPHNEYLELIADYGLIGFILFAAAWCYGLICILIASLKTKEARHAFIGFAFLGTAAGTMVHSFFDFEMHVFPNALVFVFLAAIAAGPLLGARRVKGHRRAASGNGGEDRSKRERATNGGFSIRNGREQHEGANEQDMKQCKVTRQGFLGSLRLRKACAWLLAAGFLLLTIVCLQTMPSAFIRAMGDKADVSPPHARSLYELAVRIDHQNWRAYKGIAALIYKQRYYSLDLDEKVQLAGEEIGWYEKAHFNNRKDPETAIAYGKCLIFLAKVGSIAPGERSGIEGSKSLGSMPDDDVFSPKEQIEQGLDLLREACTYRPFNDIYWWTLGVELRKLGCYDEALEVFKKAQLIQHSPSNIANIKWINRQMKLPPATTGSSVVEGRDSEKSTAKQQPSNTTEWILPDLEDAATDRELMDLFKRMGE